MENEVTVLDVLKDAMETLNKISIPMSMINDIGLPLARSINSIKACVDAMEEAEAKKKQAEPAGEEDA